MLHEEEIEYKFIFNNTGTVIVKTTGFLFPVILKKQAFFSWVKMCLLLDMGFSIFSAFLEKWIFDFWEVGIVEKRVFAFDTEVVLILEKWVWRTIFGEMGPSYSGRHLH